MKPLKHHFRNLALAVTSLVIAVGLGEWILGRAIPDLLDHDSSHEDSHEWDLPDVELGFVRKPSFQWSGIAYNDPLAHHVVYRTDEHGFRNALGNRNAEIVFIGDSFTEAGTVPEGHTFVHSVGAQLNRTVANLGRGRYGPQEELTVLKRHAFHYQPSVVVWVVFEGNDLRDAYQFATGRRMEVARPYNAYDRPTAQGSIWFDAYRLYKLGPPPVHEFWQEGPTLAFNDENFLRAHVVSKNLIRNGSFERGRRGMANWIDEIPVDVEVSQERLPNRTEVDHALRVTLSGNRDLWLRQRIDGLEPGAKYVLVGDIKTENLGGAARLAVGSTDSSFAGFNRQGAPIYGTQDWKRQGLIFTMPDHAIKFNVFLRRKPTAAPDVAPPRPWWRLPRTTTLLQRIISKRRPGTPLSKYMDLQGTYRTSLGDSLKIGFWYRHDPTLLETYPLGWQELKRCLNEAQRSCVARNVRLVVVYIPIKLCVEGPFTVFDDASFTDLSDWLPAGDPACVSDLELRLQEVCEHVGCDFLNARPALLETSRKGIRTYAARYDTHLDVDGHAVVAELVADALSSSLPEVIEGHP